MNNQIKDISTFIGSGITPRGGKKNYKKAGIPFIRSQNILMNNIKFDNIAYITKDMHENMKRTWVKNGDVLLNITGASIGRVAVYKGSDNEANVNQHVCIIRLKNKIALPEYISFHLSSPISQTQIWTIQRGASRQALNYRQVKSLDIYLPNISEQKKFISVVNKYKQYSELQYKSLEHIIKLFNNVLHNIFSGNFGIS